MYIANMVECPRSLEKKDNEIRMALGVLILYQPLLVSRQSTDGSI